MIQIPNANELVAQCTVPSLSRLGVVVILEVWSSTMPPIPFPFLGTCYSHVKFQISLNTMLKVGQNRIEEVFLLKQCLLMEIIHIQRRKKIQDLTATSNIL